VNLNKDNFGEDIVKSFVTQIEMALHGVSNEEISTTKILFTQLSKKW
jgi:hypothetical protein